MTPGSDPAVPVTQSTPPHRPGTTTTGWRDPARIWLVIGVAVAVIVRIALLPTVGVRDDMDQFVGWIHRLTTLPFGDAYTMDLSFPPVMVYIFKALATFVPIFQTVTTGDDPLARAAVKLPASLADLGLAAGVAFLLRDRPRWAISAAVAILLLPGIIDISAWWGQFEALYVLPALIAVVLLARDRPLPAAVFLGISLMTKPQALPFLVPIVAYGLGRFGIRRTLIAGVVTVATIVVIWLPFLPNGPADYLHNLATYQGDIFAVLSVRAWNLWWLIQTSLAGSDFLGDQTPFIGPFTARTIGLVLAGLGALLVFVLVLRRPTIDALVLGLAGIVLVSFNLLTTMHERYSYGAVIFLAALLPLGVAWSTWLVVSVVFTLNILAVFPPLPVIGEFLPVDGPVSILGSVAYLGAMVAVLLLLASLPATKIERSRSSATR